MEAIWALTPVESMPMNNSRLRTKTTLAPKPTTWRRTDVKARTARAGSIIAVRARA
jgi:hypothetical protein